MPMGLDAAIKKRTSGEFKMEQKSGSMSFSNAQQSESTSIQKESRQLSSFQEESTESFGGNQMQQKAFQSSVDSMKSSFSSMQSSQVSQSSSSFQSSSSSKMSMSSSQTMSSVTSAKTVSSSSFKSGFSQEAQISSSDWDSQQIIQNQNQEIKQDNLKTQIVSAITDLEGDRDLADFGRENKTIDLMSPPQAKSPTPKQQTPFTPTKQDPFSPAKQDMFSPPPLERYEPPQQQQQQAEVAPQQVQPEPAPLSNGHGQPGAAPTRNAQNGFQNGFTEFVSSSTSKNMEMQQIEEFSQSTRVNGGYQETGSVQESNSSNSLLQKIMTPASVEYDTGSMKKKDPKKMFTDSSFYNSKYHPTIQDQVEMAHKLSAAMFSEQGKGTKGARMYLTRMENSGGFGDDVPKHDNVPNMKLVMNPEGKVHLWDDLPEDQRPDLSQVAVHAAPNLSLPEVADPVAESLNAGIGKGGELFTKRKQKADSWVVDDSTIGRSKPSAAADKFIQEQTQQQLAFQQQQQFEQQQKQQIHNQQAAAREAELQQQQLEAKQAFMQQQQFKQEQSMEVRRIQEMAQQEINFPENFQHTSLKGRSFTPSLDLGCHNVQGINVWANTAPRGWGSAQRSKATPTRNSNPPSLAVCPATPSADADADMMARMEQTRLREEEERRLLEQERQAQYEEQIRLQEQEQLRLKQEQEEQYRREQQEEQRRIEELRLREEQERQEQLRRQQEEEMRRQEEEMRRQQEEQMRRQKEEEMRRQQEEQMRIQQEEQMRRQQEEQMRRQQEEQMRLQQEEQMRRQQEEQMRLQQEEQMRRQQEEQMMMRQREEQMTMQRMQQEEEQRVMQQQQRMQQEEQQRQISIQQQQQMMQQQSVQQTQQQMLQQEQQTVQQQSQQTTIQQKIAKAGGFSYGAIPTKGPQSQPAMPPMSSSSMSFESSQSQQFSSVQQSSSSSFSQQHQSSNQVYESQEFNGGVMKGYKIKGEEEANQRDSGIFTGINGDANSLVDDEFDYKKHTVKDLAKHFALVKPKQNIPHNILPEQRMFNGDHAPQLNYLGANEAGAVLQSNTSNRREVSQQDIEASKAAYEQKKKQQLEQQQHQVTSSSSTSQQSSSTVVRRTEASSSSSSEQKSERRMSLRDSLMMDPAKAHADAGLIDPSAILRGSDITGRKSTTEGMNQSSVQGETDKVLNKWDNHNTIARGWTGVKANYHPVTFRNIYNVDTQKNESSLQL